MATFKHTDLAEIDILKTKAGASTLFYKPPVLLHAAANLSDNSGNEVTISSFSLPANALSVNGQMLRINARIRMPQTTRDDVDPGGTDHVLVQRTYPRIKLEFGSYSRQFDLNTATDAAPGAGQVGLTTPWDSFVHGSLVDINSLLVRTGATTQRMSHVMHCVVSAPANGSSWLSATGLATDFTVAGSPSTWHKYDNALTETLANAITIALKVRAPKIYAERWNGDGVQSTTLDTVLGTTQATIYLEQFLIELLAT